jgi:hypothetical protein
MEINKKRGSKGIKKDNYTEDRIAIELKKAERCTPNDSPNIESFEAVSEMNS